MNAIDDDLNNDKSNKETLSILFGTFKAHSKLVIKFAWRNATRSRYRTFLLILGITLTIALETGIVVSVDTLYDDFLLDHRHQNYTDITVNPLEFPTFTELKQLSQTVRSVRGVSKASPVYYINVDSLLNISVGSNILLMGIDSSTHPDFAKLNVSEGVKKVSSTTIMVSQSIRNQGVEIGDKFNLHEIDTDLLDMEVTIGGVISDEPYFANKLLFLFVLVDIDTLVNSIPANRLSMLTAEIDVEVTNLLNIRATRENIEDRLGPDYIVWEEKDISEIEATGIRAYQTAMNLVIIASFVVEFLFITNILVIAIRDRQREFGILRAVGTESKQLVELIAVEILIYALFGGIIGIFIGIGFSMSLVELIDSFYTKLEFQEISIHFNSIFATLLSGVIVALISGLYPIILAIKMPVVQNIHSRMRTIKKHARFGEWKYTLIAGILLTTTGFILQMFVGPSRFLDFEVISIHFFVVLLIFIGTLLLEIGLLFFLPQFTRRVLIWFGLVTRTISSRNIAREFQKSLFTIMTAALALSFIILVGLTSAAVIKGVPDYFNSQWGVIDLVAEARDSSLPNISFTEDLESMDRVERSSFLQETRTEIQGQEGYIFGVNSTKYRYFSEPTIDRLIDIQSYEFLDRQGEYVVNETTGNVTFINRTYGLISNILYQRIQPYVPLGGVLSVRISENTTQNVTLAAIIKANIFLGSGEYLYISSTKYQQFFNSTLAKWFVCQVSGSVERVQSSIESRYSDILKEVIGITYFTEMMEKSLIFQAALFQVLFVESFILAALAQFICILVSTLHMEREMGIMRSMGLNKRGVLGIFMAESTALGIIALIIGVIDGLIGAVLLAWYISLSIPINIQFMHNEILIWIAISFLITLTSTILPSYRSSRKNVVATISGHPMTKGYKDELKPKIKTKDALYAFWDEQRLPKAQINSIFPSQTENLYSKNESATKDLLKFISSNKLEIQTVFLVLMAILTFNYICDSYIIIRGFLPTELLWRVILRIAIPPPVHDDGMMLVTSYLYNINPLMFFVGLASVGIISFYLINKKAPDNLFSFGLKSIFWGITGILFILIIVLLSIVGIVLLASFFTANIASNSMNIIFLIVYAFAAGLLIIFIAFWAIQRFWGFLIVKGVNPELKFIDGLLLTKRIGGKGYLTFISFLLIHTMVQSILTLIFSPGFEFDSYRGMIISTVNPLTFLIQAGYESSFLIFLIIFSIIQFKSQVNEIVSTQIPGITETPREIQTLKAKTVNIADTFITKNFSKIILEKDGSQVYIENIQGIKILFFKRSTDLVPYAMNYANYWPKKDVFVKETINTVVRVPLIEHMTDFIKLVESSNLDLRGH